MGSLISSSSAHFMVSHPRFSYLNTPCFFPIVLIITPPKRHHIVCPKRNQVRQKKKNQFLFELSDYCGVVRMCKRWEGEGDLGLELEVLEFMKNSKNPDMFPSRRELIEAGRVDLAEAILKRGGWMSMGWEEDEVEREEAEDRLARNGEFSFEKYSQNGYQSEGRSGSELNEGNHLEGNFSPSSSGRSLELAADDSGIEGILSRLERQRSLSFGFNMGQNGSINHVSGDFGEDEKSTRTSKDGDSCHSERTERASLHNDGHMHRENGSNISYANVFSNSLKANTWRTWSIQRAGISDAEFEAAEIEFGRDTNGRTVDTALAPIIADTNDVDEPLNNTKDSNSCVQEITQTDVKTRLQHLELELSSALLSLRSNTDDLSNKAKEYSSEDLRQLSDASEFQENELMSAQDKLRSLRAKLAVLEGKMALAIIDAQKILDEKQKRIDNARRALQLLRTTCIVWPNSGSEVLLAGSYDGWATQRKMERSSTGIFSLCLKLYPGKYEIKFIVDGSWKIDPLRPIVSHNGFENNLLIID